MSSESDKPKNRRGYDAVYPDEPEARLWRPAVAPGKRTLTRSLPGPVQRLVDGSRASVDTTPQESAAQSDPCDLTAFYADTAAGAAPMPGASASPVQRSASMSAMDAPRTSSMRAERATISAEGAPTPASTGQVDAPRGDSIAEDRATIAPDAGAAPGPLSPAQAERAARRNRRLADQHGVTAADVGTDAAPDTPAFAQAVAALQAEHGLAVDGIAGPKTAAALGGDAPASTDGVAGANTEGVDARGSGSSLLQMKAGADAAADEDVHRAAAAGTASGGQPLPYLDQIQQSFGRHDVSGVTAHAGGPAADASHAMGAVAYASGDRVAFASSSPSLELVAHEAAHVVQQRGGVQLKGGVGVGGDTYERHADDVAATVGRGESAEALLDGVAGQSSHSAGGAVVQRFGAREHQDLGNEATNNEALNEFPEFAAEYGAPLSFGDMVMLAADLFGSVDEVRGHLKTKAGRARVAWARWWTSGKRGTEPALDDAVKEQVETRYKQLATQNSPHFSAGGTAASSYEKAHEKALEKAFVAGAMGGSFDEAVTDEAFSHHYLSDMFAAGHVRTPRTEIKTAYEELFPDGIERFIAYMAHGVVEAMKVRAQAYANANPKRTNHLILPIPATEDRSLSRLWHTEIVLFEMASQVVAEIRKLGGAALSSASVGDIVALAHHNADNRGLNVVSDLDPSGKRVPDGFRWHSVGDNALNDPSADIAQQIQGAAITRQMVLAAMKASRAELDEAHQEGKRQANSASSPSWTGPSSYKAVGFIPRVDEQAPNVDLTWEWGSMSDEMKKAIDDAIRGDIVPELMAVAPGTWTWAGPKMYEQGPDGEKHETKRDMVYRENLLKGEVRYVAGLRLEVGAGFFDFAMRLNQMGHVALEQAMTTEVIPDVPIPARGAAEPGEANTSQQGAPGQGGADPVAGAG